MTECDAMIAKTSNLKTNWFCHLTGQMRVKSLMLHHYSFFYFLKNMFQNHQLKKTIHRQTNHFNAAEKKALRDKNVNCGGSSSGTLFLSIRPWEQKFKLLKLYVGCCSQKKFLIHCITGSTVYNGILPDSLEKRSL